MGTAVASTDVTGVAQKQCRPIMKHWSHRLCCCVRCSHTW